MSGELKPYPEYKDSGVEWLGEVPGHWAVSRLKSLVTNVADQTTERQDGEQYIALEHVQSWTGTLDNMGGDAPSGSQLKRFGAGDVLFGKLRPYLAKVTRPQTDGCCVGEFFVLRSCDVRLANDYLERLLRSKPVIDSVDRSTFGARMPRAEWGSLGNMRIARPPLDEQSAIVRFLDHADRRIQRCIRTKEELSALLEEQKQVIIHHAVTGRIDVRTGKPYPACKDSGVAWLGAIPAYWDVSRLGKVIDLTVGFPFKSEGFTQSEEDIRLLRGINVAPGQLRWDDVVRWPASDVSNYAEFQLSVGDIILGMDRPIVGGGVRVAIVSEPDMPSLLLQRVARIRPIEAKLTRGFAMRLLSGTSFSDYLAPIFTGISVPHLSPEQIRGFQVALPSLPEQRAIGDYLDSIADRTARAVSHTRSQISCMHEYRTRLIADVVTGKLDVREAAAALPEVDPLVADDPDDHVEASGDPMSALGAETAKESH